MSKEVVALIWRCVIVVVLTIIIAVMVSGCTQRDTAEVEKIDQNAKYEPTDIQKAEIVATTLSHIIEQPPVKVSEPVIEEVETDVMDIQPMVRQDDETVEYPKLYTDEDVIAMAKLLYGEARGVEDLYIWDGRVISSEYQKACVVWTVLNRYDAGWEDSIVETAAAYKQFHGYDPEHPVEEEFVILAYDVLERWNREQHGETEVGRVLPKEYIYFYGDMKNNYFLEEYKDWDEYNWDLEDPYM